jgi:hypothetical protein
VMPDTPSGSRRRAITRVCLGFDFDVVVGLQPIVANRQHRAPAHMLINKALTLDMRTASPWSGDMLPTVHHAFLVWLDLCCPLRERPEKFQ